uniref:Uncharacterized protein n=1 Tax=Micrurus spixii TaxID=129469 RepID=A0A2D4N3V2_9SAUR
MPPKVITVSWMTSHPISLALGVHWFYTQILECLCAQPGLDNIVYTLPPRFWMKDPLLQTNLHSEQQPRMTGYLGRTERDEMQGLQIYVLNAKQSDCATLFFGSTLSRFEQEQLRMTQDESKMTMDLTWEEES